MHLRIVSARSGGQQRRYVQLVRSVRGANGVPTNKVIANLGSLSDAEVENLRRALQASRTGQAVVLPSATPTEEWRLRIVANVAYLDIAVALAMWKYWKLSELLNRLLPRGAELVATADVVLPLVLQRCLAPGSKLYAQRWLPRTALPELLGLGLDRFNNSRIHRALKDLDSVEGSLQDELAKRYEQRDGAFAALFLDVTDTYFQGRGCGLAERDRTKEGLRNVHKIGIVLLCNEHGYPMRWQVVGGKRRDPQCMEGMVEQVEALPWTRGVPFVCDRGMGHAAGVARLVSSGLRFLTATRVTEIASYTQDLPNSAFADLWPADTELSRDLDVERARKAAAEGTDLEKVDDTLFVKDLGVCTRTLHVASPPIDATGAEHDPAAMEGGAAFVALARILRRRLDVGEAKNQAALAREHSLTRARVTQLLNLLRLDLGLQEKILRGDFGYMSERVLRKAVHCKAVEAQRKLLEDFAEKQSGGGCVFRRTGAREVELRLIAYFNPEMFVDQRARAMRRRQEIDAWVEQLNQWLPSVRRSREEVYRHVLNKLTGNNLVGAYDVRVDPLGAEEDRRWRVTAQLDEDEWRRRRRFDGFVLLIAHPELPQNARAMAELYRAKDAVEKDFRTIKEVIKLRPVFHHTDPKVRAHVTLCMLALLVERTLEQRLRRSSTPLTASACFEVLRECRLNLLRVAPETPTQYRLTDPSSEQRAILHNLRLADLLDEEVVQAQLRPRDAA
jgi:hypothetical protein